MHSLRGGYHLGKPVGDGDYGRAGLLPEHPLGTEWAQALLANAGTGFSCSWGGGSSCGAVGLQASWSAAPRAQVSCTGHSVGAVSSHAITSS